MRYIFAGLLVLLGVASAEAQSRNAFCARWHNVCKSTCPAGTPKVSCHATCADRLAACRSSGCYHFNNPGPRCQGQTR